MLVKTGTRAKQAVLVRPESSLTGQRGEGVWGNSTVMDSSSRAHGTEEGHMAGLDGSASVSLSPGVNCCPFW